jgi:adenylate kinase family enzyme
MNLVKTLVIGDSGSGKSWRSEQLATAFGSVWVDLDLLHWEPGGYNMPRKREDVIAMARDAAASERWGFEGIDGWIVSEIRSAATALVWIDLDESENVASPRRQTSCRVV